MLLRRCASTRESSPAETGELLQARSRWRRGTESAVRLISHGGSRIGSSRHKRCSRVELERSLQGNALVSESRKTRQLAQLGKKESTFLRLRRTKIGLNDFRTVKVIGKGAFGEVGTIQIRWAPIHTPRKGAFGPEGGHREDLRNEVAEEGRDVKEGSGEPKLYASSLRQSLTTAVQLAHVRAERDILAESKSEWVVSLFYSFQDPTFLYLVMEFLPGGDLMTMLIKYDTFSEDVTRFYMAECLLAIEAVHRMGFIHRDIKPDNILMYVLPYWPF